MDRREFLKSTGAAAAAATATTAAVAESATAAAAPSGVAAPNLATGIVELRLAISWPDAVAGPADQARRLGQRLAAMTGGRYRIAFVTGIGDGLAAVRTGEADLYYASEHDHLGPHRALAFFAGLPGDRGIAARHLSAWMLVGGGQQLWDDLAGDLGVKAMLAGHTGEQPCFVASRRVSEMSELAGGKVAVSGLARDVVRGFGLEPAAIPVARTADALARGELVAAECGGAITSYALGLLRAASCSAGTSVNRHGSTVSIGIRRSLWDSLSASDQALFGAAAAAEFELALAEEEAHRRLLYPASLAAYTWPVAPELSRTIQRVADAVVAHVAASDTHAQRINAGYEAFRRALLPETSSLLDAVT
jgi:TRAP-type mannitol/chloroaromatic compound transport system substrate-binding protein